MLKKVKRERFIWLDIIITLITLELMAYFYYGIRAVAVAVLCVTVSLAAEIISLRLMHHRFTADDLTCTSDALILSLMLPAVIDYKIAAIASIFAVIVAKNIFGGRSNMIFSPSAAAYVFIAASWSKQLLLYPLPHTKYGIFDSASDLVYSASHDFNLTGKIDHTDFEILLGNFSGPCGAVSILLLIVAAFILIFRGDISAGAFIGSVLGTNLLAFLSPVDTSAVDSVKYTLAANMVLFASIYIISDKRIAPKRNYYAFFYGYFIAVISYILLLTTAKENAIVLVSVLATPVALGFKNLEKRIEIAAEADIQIETEAEKISENTILEEISEKQENLTDETTEEPADEKEGNND